MKKVHSQERIVEENAELIDFEIQPGKIVKERKIKALRCGRVDIG